MKITKRILVQISLFIIVVLVLNSCTRRVYTTTTSLDAISQLPPDVEKKGDFSVDAGVEAIDAVNTYSDDYINDYRNVYRFLGVTGINLNGQVAVSDKLSIGMSYRFNQESYSNGHIIAPSVNFFKNHPTTRVKGKIGLDVQVGIQYKQGNLYMAVDEYVYDGYLNYIDLNDDDSIVIIYGTFQTDAYPLGYFTMKQKYLRPYIQPTFSYEHPWLAVYVGANLAVQNNLQYKVSLQESFMDYLAENDFNNPLTYYRQQKTVIMGEFFTAFAAGPPYCRVFFKQGLNFTSDKYQKTLVFISAGIKSSISSGKKKEAPTESF
jgi:hypothetical protein